MRVFATLIALCLLFNLSPKVAHAERAWVTAYTDVNGKGWPYRSVIACPPQYYKFTVVRILGTRYGSYDEYTSQNDLYSCQDHYATYLGFHFDIWVEQLLVNPFKVTGIYTYQILGVVQ